MNHKSTPRFHDLDQQNLAISPPVACKGRERLCGVVWWCFFPPKLTLKKPTTISPSPFPSWQMQPANQLVKCIFYIWVRTALLTNQPTYQTIKNIYWWCLGKSVDWEEVWPWWHYPKNSKKDLVKKLLSWESNRGSFGSKLITFSWLITLS